MKKTTFAGGYLPDASNFFASKSVASKRLVAKHRTVTER
jgi:hypothetical protein